MMTKQIKVYLALVIIHLTVALAAGIATHVSNGSSTGHYTVNYDFVEAVAQPLCMIGFATWIISHVAGMVLMWRERKQKHALALLVALQLVLVLFTPLLYLAPALICELHWRQI